KQRVWTMTTNTSMAGDRYHGNATGRHLYPLYLKWPTPWQESVRDAPHDASPFQTSVSSVGLGIARSTLVPTGKSNLHQRQIQPARLRASIFVRHNPDGLR